MKHRSVVILLCMVLTTGSLSYTSGAKLVVYSRPAEGSTSVKKPVLWNHSGPGKPFGAYYTRLSFDDKHTGKYADVVVRLDKLNGQIEFSRESGYLPLWRNKNGSWYFKEMIERKGDGPDIRPDKYNKYCYARVIENNSTRVVVHWRYIPDADHIRTKPRQIGKKKRKSKKFLDMVDYDHIRPDGVVHEYFTITPFGKIRRTIRKGTKRFDDWEDPRNVAVQNLGLRANGIIEYSFFPVKLQHLPGKPVKGNRTVKSAVGRPAAWWKFDEGLVRRPYDDEFKTKESVKGYTCAISGNKAFWKAGVSGTALAFNGYLSKVILPVSKAPSVSSGLTLDVWVAIGAYPFNDTAIIQQSDQTNAGYFLGVTTHGNILFMLGINSDFHKIEPKDKLTVNRWTHIAATYDKAASLMRLYVDGVQKGSKSVPGNDITMNQSDLMIGNNNIKKKATDLVRPFKNISQIFGIEGLIDEVKIYDTALSSSQVAASYKKFMPGRHVVDNPDLQARILPGETGSASRFGAYYTRLPYHDLWQTMWCASEHQDLVIKFGQKPVSMVFWRGMCFVPAWVTENNKWMSDQSAEIGGPLGCAEHMGDKQARFTHVRLIENTPARIVVHWRHACADIGYNFRHDRAWSDEYHTIYPDNVSIRHVNFRKGSPGWHEPQLISQAGTGPLDNISMKAVSLANLDGKVLHLDWSDGPPKNPFDDANIELYNLKSDYKVFGIFPANSKMVTSGWFNTEQSRYTPDPFAGPWNHWPVSQLLSDGRLASAYDRVTSCALGERRKVTILNIGMYGFINKPISTLIPLARSWCDPAEVSDVSGADKPVYDPAQRAYKLEARASRISFSLKGSKLSPIENPAFVIYNWGKKEAIVKVDGKTRASGVRQGHVMTAEKDTLIVFIECLAAATTRFEIARK